MVVEWSCTCLVQKLGQHQLESFCLLIDNVIRILKKRARGMSCHAHLIFFVFLELLRKVIELRKIQKKLMVTALASQQSSLVLSQ